jgi:hypothetical protein
VGSVKVSDKTREMSNIIMTEGRCFVDGAF